LSEDSQHQLDDSDFGIRGIEKSQNWSPMVSADPVSNPDDIPTDGTMSESELARAKRPAEADWGELTEREYYNNATGEPTPERQSVSPEQAGKDLANVREQERAAREQVAQDDLRAALDATEQPAQQDQQQPVDEIQPEATEAPAGRETWDPVDQKIGQFLESDPAIAERIQSSYAQVVQQSQAHVEQVRQVYAAATNQLSREIEIVTAALIPEIVGMSPEQARGAMAVIAKNDPARAQQIANFANRVQGAVNLTQQQAHAQKAANEQQFAAYQEQAAQNFKQFAEAQDAKVFLHDTPESVAAIRKTILADAKAAGVSEKELYEAYNTVPALRHSFVQSLIADGARWRAAQRSITQSRANPVPRVQRPGVSVDGPRVHEGDLAAAASRFNLPGGNVGTQGLRNAAAWVTAKRGGR
jgi:hypothetical protein